MEICLSEETLVFHIKVATTRGGGEEERECKENAREREEGNESQNGGWGGERK